ncbi:VWA domain-containing protein [Streptomyces sp. NPDC005925]|uniref:vWA domain-containing protein n=1 Tax=Streptomyces sp. NPDC005925 TaxID=3157172 RepID=UPI0033C66210
MTYDRNSGRDRLPQPGIRLPRPGIRLSVELDGDPHPDRSARIEAHVQVDVAADGVPGDLPADRLAVVIAVDVAEPNRAAVRHALPAVLRALPDRMSFAVLGSGPEPVRCYPRGDAPWAVADREERRRAAFVAGALPLHRDGPRPAGYAAWVAASRILLAARPVPVRHLVLITDGSSAAGETRLEAELDACEGQFSCHVFAVGADWAPDPLLTLAERLHGAAEFVDDGLGRAITQAIHRLLKIHTPQLPIEVTVRPTVRKVSLSESSPRPYLLGGLRLPGPPMRWSFPTHQWEQGRRDYLLTLTADADADPLGTELQFAMVTIGDVHAPVTARWRLPGQSPPPGPAGTGSVRALNDTARMHTALRQGLLAVKQQQRDAAEDYLGQAARLAARRGESWALDEIRTVADIEDSPAMRVRLRHVDTSSLGSMILRVGSRAGLPPAETTGTRPGVRCVHCATPGGSEARYCIACGKELR